MSASARVPVSPALLAWACDRAGGGVEAFKGRFPHLLAWLREETTPTLKQLESFAHATHAPLGYFFLPAPPDERLPLPDFRTFADERLSRPSADLLETIYACQRRQDWYRELLVEEGAAPLAFVGSQTVATSPVACAAEMARSLRYDAARQALGSAEELRRALSEAAEGLGVLVMCSGVVGNDTNRRLRTEEFRGFVLVDNLAPIVFVNATDSRSAQVFTLAHELAHVWLGVSGVSDVDVSSTAEVERWCNAVAAELLVPLAALRVSGADVTMLPDEMERLAKRFHVSTLVILRRLHDAGLIDRSRLRSEYNRELERLLALPRATKTEGGNFHATEIVRVSKRFARALVADTLEGRTALREACALLAITSSDAFDGLAKHLADGS